MKFWRLRNVLIYSYQTEDQGRQWYWSHLRANSGLRSKDGRILQLKESQTGKCSPPFLSLCVLFGPSVDCILFERRGGFT